MLGTDGALHVIDPLTGDVTAEIPVVGAWQEPDVWQDPRPTLFVLGSTAYVTEPATSSIHAVDLKTGKVVTSGSLEHVPNELTGVASGPAAVPPPEGDALSLNAVKRGTLSHFLQESERAFRLNAH